MAMTYYTVLGSRVPDFTSAGDGTTYTKGMRFSLTSSVVKASASYMPFTASVVGVKVYRGGLYTGPYTCSLWRVSDQQRLGPTCSIEPRAVPYGWESASFSTPITVSLDTDYIICQYGYANSYTYWNALFASNYYPSIGFNPLVGIRICYTATGSAANPAPPTYPAPQAGDSNAFGIDVIVSGSLIDYPVNNLRETVVRGSIGYTQGINLGGPSSIRGDSSFGKHLQIGVTQSMVSGSPAPPSLELTSPGMWRFRWAVQPGRRTISVNTKQSSSITLDTRPSIKIKADATLGLFSDTVASASISQDWVTIGPVAFTPTSNGAVWVELWNNDVYHYNENGNNSAYFDHIITT